MSERQVFKAPGLWRRMACWLYEGLLLFAVAFVSGWLFSTLGQMRNAMDERRELLQLFLLVVFGVYFAWCWSRGQTLAMKTWRIRVLDQQGRPLSQPRALLRFALCSVWFAPWVLAAAPLGLSSPEVVVLWLGWVLIWAVLSRFHPQGQFWHDAWAGTQLVDAPDPVKRRAALHPG